MNDKIVYITSVSIHNVSSAGKIKKYLHIKKGTPFLQRLKLYYQLYFKK